MLLPTRTLSPARSLVGVGATVLNLLESPKPVSRLWGDFKQARAAVPNSPTITFGWFVLSLDTLFALNLIRLDHGRVTRTRDDSPTVQ